MRKHAMRPGWLPFRLGFYVPHRDFQESDLQLCHLHIDSCQTSIEERHYLLRSLEETADCSGNLLRR
jgi:hypothetical protein